MTCRAETAMNGQNPIEAYYLTRSDLSGYSPNANAYQKPLMFSRLFKLTILHPQGTKIPVELAQACIALPLACGNISVRWTFWNAILYIGAAWTALRQCTQKKEVGKIQFTCVATGFDIPCLLLGWWIKRRWHIPWMVCCWDPPALSWRDQQNVCSRSIVWSVDLLFRFLVRHADRLVLNIHPQLLADLKYTPSQGQLITMYNGFCPAARNEEKKEGVSDCWRVGVVSHAAQKKGFFLVLEAFIALARKLPLLHIIWIGEVSEEIRGHVRMRLKEEGLSADRFILMGKLGHQEALQQVAMCGVLLHPYLRVPSLVWNYPLKLVEYMSAGRAIIAADLPGVRTYIEPLKNGIIFEAGNVDSLCQSLFSLAGNATEQMRLGTQARNDSKKFEWPILNEELALKVYEGCIHGAR